MRPALLLLLLSGCAAKAPTEQVRLSWFFDDSPSLREVRVVPVLPLHETPEANLESYVGRPLSDGWSAVRRERAQQLREVPALVAQALPGEVNGQLGTAWEGQFRSWTWPTGAEARLVEAFHGERPLHHTLGEVAREVGGDATLLSWVEEIDGEPLSLHGFPGDTVDTPWGPVVVEPADEPVWVTATVGMALVTRQGEVVVRYSDTYQALLSAHRPPALAARELARGLVDEVALAWALDPRLGGVASAPDLRVSTVD